MRGIRWQHVALALASSVALLYAQAPKIVWTDQEKPIVEQMRTLRSLPDDQRTVTTRQLALQIRDLPAGDHQQLLAESLANLVTEGDPGAETLQAVAVTLADTLRNAKPSAQATAGYSTLAQFVRYEHVPVSTDDPRMAAAIAKLEADDRARQTADFTLTDLSGRIMDPAGPARQSRAGEFLGHVVPAVPQGDARSGSALSTVRG